jgi:cytochrome c biogenesis protein
MVEYGLLARGEDFGLREENVSLRRQFEKTWPVVAPEADLDHRQTTSSTAGTTGATENRPE